MLRNMLHIQKDYTLSLHNKLQQWLIPSSQRHMTHKWYYDSNQQEIYHNQNQKILHYFKRQLSYNVIEHNLDSETKTDLILDNVTPITIVKKILLLPSILFNTHNTIHLKNLKTTYITFARVKKNYSSKTIRKDNVELFVSLIQSKNNLIISSGGIKLETKSGIA